MQEPKVILVWGWILDCWEEVEPTQDRPSGPQSANWGVTPQPPMFPPSITWPSPFPVSHLSFQGRVLTLLGSVVKRRKRIPLSPRLPYFYCSLAFSFLKYLTKNILFYPCRAGASLARPFNPNQTGVCISARQICNHVVNCLLDSDLVPANLQVFLTTILHKNLRPITMRFDSV